jgi:hypothetical protein
MPASPPPKGPRADNGSLATSARGSRRAPTALGWCWRLSLAAPVLLTVSLAPAQEALHESLAGDAAAQARSRQQESMPYTFKSGDFKLLVTPSLNLGWNDNINLAHTNVLQDFIFFPALGLKVNYPLTQRNLLQLDVTFGYQEYLDHSDYSRLYVQSGSALSYDVYIKDFWINLHDRFSYVQNPPGQAAVAATGTYGTAQNMLGFNTTWDLEDVTLSLGYDHQNYWSTTPEFSYTDRASELVVGRGGFRFHPTLTAGVEGTVSSTAYDQPVLNNNMGYSAGVFADWQPGHYFHFQPRFGYMLYQFQQTSQSIPAVNQGAWYFDLTATHELSDVVSYSFSAGHEITLGVYGDTIEDWYIRPAVNLKMMKDLTLTTSFSYQDGSQALQTTPGAGVENYDWFMWGLSLNYAVVQRLNLGLTYGLTYRVSNYAFREYTQNVVSLILTYTPE